MAWPDWVRTSEVPTVQIGDKALPVIVRRLPQARRFTLRLAADGSEVRVAIPHNARTADALAFARDQTDWLAGQLARVQQTRTPGPGEALPYRGGLLSLVHLPAGRRRPTLDGDSLFVGGPLEGLPRRLRTWLESEARRLLADDLLHYCKLAGLELPALGLSNAQRRWGSCSARGTVRINWRLVMAPDEVRRSVVAHEVAHLVHFDHSPAFRRLLGTLFEGDLAAADRWLKAQGRGLYLPFG